MIVEMHPCPEKAVSDGAQSLEIGQFRNMMRELRPYMDLWAKDRMTELAVAV